MLEFMKQVLPRLLRPVAPFSVGTGIADKDIMVKFEHLAEGKYTKCFLYVMMEIILIPLNIIQHWNERKSAGKH